MSHNYVAYCCDVPGIQQPRLRLEELEEAFVDEFAEGELFPLGAAECAETYQLRERYAVAVREMDEAWCEHAEVGCCTQDLALASDDLRDNLVRSGWVLGAERLLAAFCTHENLCSMFLRDEEEEYSIIGKKTNEKKLSDFFQSPVRTVCGGVGGLVVGAGPTITAPSPDPVEAAPRLCTLP